MRKIVFLLALSFHITNAQNQKLGVVLDFDNKNPVEFVDVYNSKDNTITNENGKYFLLSTNDSISFYKLGYEEIKTTFDKAQDTIYLVAKPFELAEIVVSNEDSLFDMVKKQIAENYPIEEFNEKFFIRSLLRYDGKITRIQDIQGNLKRKTLLYAKGMELKKKDFVFEVQNMRKIGLKDVTENDTNIYFKFRSLKQILSETVQISLVRENFEIEEKYFDEKNKVRIEFNYIGENIKDNIEGYYIIDLEDNAILEFYLIRKPKSDFVQKKDIKFRVTLYEKKVIFKKDSSSGKYVIKNGKLKTTIEVKNNADTFQTFFESEDVLKSYGHFASIKVRKNVNENKDVFKLDFPYNEYFWNTQNQLLLTNEMLVFIKSMGDKNKEFDIKSNLK
ncbi:hypothetical protein [Croceitalea rosinachiae]|uniref:CarboxypepD_reg-like domain-containing protein n=1 Tax=Croceitalea rosinachiae TaxID=3075596 RepID=A0ABU3AEI6_9FLAO|nr:hypothetical protein [Croceitalea sp. F388]MDT0608601.1 hypothetical protein [Croceitalea sp. F388]